MLPDISELSEPVAPLLSVTVLNYNYGHYLPTCLASILAQQFVDYEIILINDNSTDNSLDIIQPYLKDSRIQLVHHSENQGFVKSLIEGCELSRGKYITVISADDWIYTKEAFSQQVAVMEQDEAISFVYTAYGHFNDAHELSYIWRASSNDFILNKQEAFTELVFNPYILHTGTIIRKNMYYEIGGYASNLKYSVDTRLWLGLCHLGKVAYLNQLHYAYRRHGNNMSKNVTSLRIATNEVLDAIKWSFDLWPACEDRQWLHHLQNMAECKALIAFAIDDIFNSAYLAGWNSFRVSFQLRPLQTLFQRGTLLIFLRTFLGRRGYNRLEQFKALYSPKTRHRLETDSLIKNFKNPPI